MIISVRRRSNGDTINKLAKVAGVTTRTLRFYDGSPACARKNQFERVPHIREEGDRQASVYPFHRELGVSLEEIKNILESKDFDGLAALESHLSALLARRKQLIC